jgi:hypothetical protein
VFKGNDIKNLFSVEVLERIKKISTDDAFLVTMFPDEITHVDVD